MDQIIVGVDTSDASRRAVEFAASRARTFGDGLVVVHVIPWSPFSFNTPTENEERPARKEAEVAAAREQIIDPLEKLAAEAGVPVESIIRHGHPAETLAEIADEKRARHIVVGRTGDSGLRKRLFGGIPSHLVQVSSVPVTVVP